MSTWTEEVVEPGTASAEHVAAVRAADRLDGTALLDEVEQFIRRFCILPHEDAYAAVALWAAHTHFIDRLETTGRLACLSPEPGSGKTRVLEVLDTVCANPLLALDLSMSAFFRIVDDQRPTILLDEVDAIFTGKAKSEGTEDLRRVLNNGYRVGAVVQRVGGVNRDEVQAFRVFTPVAMAGLGNLPDTLMSRSIILRMKRRAPGEKVESWRDRIHRAEGEQIQAALAEWATTTGHMDYPALPDEVQDRDADVWEPLVMVADAAGGHWPARARQACLRFIRDKPESAVSLGVRLLADLRSIWPPDQSVMATVDILAELADLDEAPWADLYGEGLKPRKLAALLSDYGVRSTNVRTAAGVAKGYRREDLWDTWNRYVPTPSPQKRYKGYNGDIAGQSVADAVADTEGVADKGNTNRYAPQPADQHKHPQVAAVADVAHSQGTSMCTVCGHRLIAVEPGQTTHPGCAP